MDKNGNKFMNTIKKAALFVAVLFCAILGFVWRGIKFIWGYIAYALIAVALFIKKLFMPLYIKTTALRTLVKMQLKDKTDMSWLRSTKGIIFKVIFTILSFVAITGIVYLILWAATKPTPILSVTGKLDAKVIVFVFTIMQVLSIITVTLGLTKSLYFASDNKVLLTLPVKPNTLFFSKIIVYYITELKKSFAYMAPLFIAFALLNSYSFVFYLVLIVGFLFVALFVVLLAAFLSIPTMYIVSLLKRNPYIQMGVLVLGLGAIVFIFLNLMASVPPELNLIQNMSTYYGDIRNFLANFERWSGPFKYLTHLLTGEEFLFRYNPFPLSSLWTLLVLIGSIGVLGAASWFIARPLFFKMTSKQFEYRKKQVKIKRPNRKHNEFMSSFKKELILSTRTPAAFFSTFVFVFVLPFAILLLNTIFTSMNTSLQGSSMCISFNLLIMLMILLTNNTSNASLFSREGAAIYLLKTKPATYVSSLLSKISLNYFLSIISLVLATIFFARTLNATYETYLPLFAIVMFVFTAHLLWSVDMDITKPQYKFYHDGIHSTTNPNEVKSTVLAFVLALFFFGWTFFMLIEDPNTAFIKIIVIAAALLGLRIFLNLSKAKVYFREI